MPREPVQRLAMRALYLEYNGDQARIVRQYARLERAGIIPRKSNKRRRTPEEYALALFRNGLFRGWLTK